MNIIRCKDCVKYYTEACPVKGIEHTENFYCAAATASIEYKPTNGDAIRNMSDSELAKFIDRHEHDAYLAGKYGGKLKFGKSNIDFYKGYFNNPAGKDYP